MHEASTYNKIEACKALIQNGADIFIPDEEGSTPLHLACMEGDIDLIQLLLTEAEKKNQLKQVIKFQNFYQNNT